MTDTSKKTSLPIPDFKTREEEAAFWDTHSFTDYWHQWKPVDVRFAKNLSGGVTVRLDPDTLEELRTLAKKKGIGPTTLARMWILERLDELKRQHQTT